MNVLKNFEAIFVITLGLACGANYLADGSGDTASASAAPAALQTVAMAAAAQSMPVVVVAGKRLSAAEKRQSLIDEQNAMSASRAAAQTI